MDALFDEKFLFEMLRDIDQAEMSGAFKVSNEVARCDIYFQSGTVVYACQVLATGECVDLSQPQVSKLVLPKKGKFQFDGSLEAPKENEWRLRAANLILTTARSVEEDLLKAEYNNPEQLIIGPVFDVINRTQGMLLSPLEFSVLSMLESPIPIARLVVALGLPEREILTSIYVLCAAGILDAPTESAECEEPVETQAFTTAVAAPSPVQSYMSPPVANPSTSIPIASTYAAPSTATTSQSQSSSYSGRRSRLNTGALEKLAGIKIRSMTGNSVEQTSNSEAEKYYQQGIGAFRSGNIAVAETMLRRAVELVPEKVNYLTTLGRLLARLPQRKKEAEGFLMEACSLDLTAVEPRLVLAELYEASEKRSEAKTLWQSILNINPENKTAQQKMAEFNKSSWSGLLNRWLK